MGAFPDSSLFNKLKISDQIDNIGNIDDSGKIYTSFLKQRWVLEVTSVLLTTAQYQSLYPFLIKQNGSSGVFTFQYPLNPQSTKLDSFDYSSKTFYPDGAMTKGSTSYSTFLKSDDDSTDGGGLMYAYPGDFITFSNHSKVYKITTTHIIHMDDIDSAGLGSTTLGLYPALVEDIPATGVTATIYKPNFTVRLASEVQSFETDTAGYFKLKFNIVEDY